MSSDIDIVDDRLWITIYANGVFELNMYDAGDMIYTTLDPSQAKDRKALEVLKGSIEHCLQIQTQTKEEDNAD